MKFLILNTDYPAFLAWLNGQHPGLEQRSYDEQMRARNESLFGVADFYSSNLRKLGHEVWDVHANNEAMQRAWAREHGLRLPAPPPMLQRFGAGVRLARRVASRTPLTTLRRVVSPVMRRLDARETWFYDILAAQIQHYRPDVLLNHAMDAIGCAFLQEMKSRIRLLIGQIAAPLPTGEDFGCYDLVISSLPNFVRHFQRSGLRAELHRLGFEPRVLHAIANRQSPVPVSFVGSLTLHHQSRLQLLEYLCEHTNVSVWGTGIDRLPKDSHIQRHYRGKAWGIDMYEALHASHITLNHHIGVAGSYANNCRLYEATGMGTLLLTDSKINMNDMFDPGREVVCYTRPEECLELIEYYLGHDDERRSIAKNGQRRTLCEHTYHQRMQELLDSINPIFR